MGKEKINFWKWTFSRWHFWVLFVGWVILGLLLGPLSIGALIVGSVEKFLFFLLMYLIAYWIVKPK